MARPKAGSRPAHIEFESRLRSLERLLRLELAGETNKWQRITILRDIKSIVVERAKIMNAYESGKEFYLRALRLESVAAAKAMVDDVPKLSTAERQRFWDDMAEHAVAKRLVEKCGGSECHSDTQAAAENEQ